MLCRSLVTAGLLGLPALAQAPVAKDCLHVGGPIYMCDPTNDWIEVELPEDLRGVGLDFGDGINAQVDVVANPLIGIQIRAQRPDIRNHPPGTTEALTKVDGFPAISYITILDQGGPRVVRVRTELLLHQLSLSAETVQPGDTYTPEHAARHAEMLRGITHEWSFE